MTVKMTMNCDYDSVLGVILPVEHKMMPIVQLHLILKLTKTHPLVYTFCQKHSGCVFASGKNGSIPTFSGPLSLLFPSYKNKTILTSE